MLDSAVRYYKKTQKKFKKRFVKDIKIFLKKKSTENENICANNIKILHKMKQKSGWVKNEILQNKKLIILISGLHFNKKSKT